MSRAWVPSLVWGAAFAAALWFVLSPPPTQADEIADIAGEAEAPTVRQILQCFALNDATLSLMAGVSDKAELDAGTGEAVRAKIDETITCATLALDTIATGEQVASLQRTTEADFAFDALNQALREYLKIRDRLAKPQRAKKVRKSIAKAEAHLLAAKLSMQGIFVEDREQLEALQRDLPLEAYVEDFDRKSIRSVIRLIEPNDLGELTVGPQGKVKKKAPRKKARRKAGAKKRRADKNRAKERTPKRRAAAKKSSRPRAKSRKSKAPKDYYLSFSAESKQQTEAGFYVLPFDRAMRGPFQAGATLGTLDERKLDPTGAAFACFEIDVVGSDPLEFVSVCARPIDGQTQVFAVGTGGADLGQRVFAGVSSVEVLLDYDGTTFQISARPEGAPENAFVQFATFSRPQGDDLWTPSVGAAGLTGKAEVGADRVFVTPR